jgi:hypothetical protein
VELVREGIPVVIGLAVSLVLEVAVSWVLRRVQMEAPAPEGLDPEQWKAVTQPSSKGPAWVGRLERVLFFFALYFHALELVAGWLVFKVGSKWEVWNNVVQVPTSLNKVDDIDYLRARHFWGLSLLHRFLIGTLANVIASILGWGAYRLAALSMGLP